MTLGGRGVHHLLTHTHEQILRDTRTYTLIHKSHSQIKYPQNHILTHINEKTLYTQE